MAIIKVDSGFFTALSNYLGSLSDNRVDLVKELHTKIDNSTNFDEKLRLCANAKGYIGEAKAYQDAKDELNKLVKELEEKFTCEEEGS